MRFLKMLVTMLFRVMFTWWHGRTFGTALYTWRRGKLVGQDSQGNRYFIDKKGAQMAGKTRRWVVFYGDVEASRVPPEWHGWLHYITDETPIDSPPAHRDWHQQHQINQTGLVDAHHPDGKQAKVGGYQAWIPDEIPDETPDETSEKIGKR